MKPLAIWLAIVGVVFGGIAIASISTRETERVFIVVDSSFPMKTVLTRIPNELDEIQNRDRAEFALATEKSVIHPYQAEIDFSGVEAFAPCSFEAIESYPAAADADERILITTSESCPTDQLVDWTIILLDP